ncbi:MAG: sigma-54-dependent Fis family transcriptional regulator [Candidatus Aureabacteria bacterium]|nr:sigma-54-dependent Fis family transcriptional regulator [Candidatus Auribacterota bacterium]
METNKTEKTRILIVDDEKNMVESLCTILRRKGYSVVTALSAEQAISICNSDRFNLIVTDARMKKTDGFKFMESIKKDFPDTEFVMITAYATPKLAVKAIKEGAFDYIAKPFDPEEFIFTVKRALEHNRLVLENKKLMGTLANEEGLRGVIGKSPQIQEICKLVYTVAPTVSPVLIEGEKGAGKELIARALHFHSARRDKPFYYLNCAGVPAGLLEKELSGCGKAQDKEAKDSCFKIAGGGTLYINEICDMPLSLQEQMLRIFKNSKYYNKKSGTEEMLDVRIISSTAKNTEDEVKKGNFREDLFYRVNIINIKVPPLRERREDIIPLAEHFLDKHSALTGKIIKGFDDDVKKLLLQHEWRGNVLELEKLVEKIVSMENRDVVAVPSVVRQIKAPAFKVKDNDDEGKEVFSGKGINYQEQVSNYEKELIELAMRKSGGSISKTAQLLKLSRHALRYQMQKLGLLGSRKKQD